MIVIDESLIYFHPFSNSFRVLASVRYAPPIHLPPTTIFLDFCPLDCQIARAPDALRNVRKAMLAVRAPKLTVTLLLPSCVSPIFGHGVHEPPLIIAKGRLPISSAIPCVDLGSNLLDNVAGETSLLHSDPRPMLLRCLALEHILRHPIC